ncbi:MAG: ankyrin repeat domain-containing protein [Brevinemataceae bacterium]
MKIRNLYLKIIFIVCIFFKPIFILSLPSNDNVSTSFLSQTSSDADKNTEFILEDSISLPEDNELNIPDFSQDHSTISPDNNNQKDSQDLIDAAKSGDISTLESILQKGVSPNSRVSRDSKNGPTILMCAAGERRINVISILLDAGADPNLPASNKNINNITALMIASIKGPIESVEILISYGANINAKTTGIVSGSTALMAAVSAKRLDIIQTLVAQGADINAKTSSPSISNVSALMLAAETGNTDIVSYLLSIENIDINAEDSQQKSALVYAYLSGNLPVISLLINAGATTSLTQDELKKLLS